MRSMAKIFLKKGAAGPTFGRHPWVYADAISNHEGDLSDGCSVEVYSDRQDYLATGLWNSKSSLRVRLYDFSGAELSDAFWKQKIAKAIHYRKSLGFDFKEPCRLIFSEADGLSGLTADFFSGVLVLQVTSLGLHRRLKTILEAFQEFVNPRAILLRRDQAVLKSEGLEQSDTPELLAGELTSQEMKEGLHVSILDMKYKVDIWAGQKTGLYLDQRDNRWIVEKISKGKAVLDLYSHVGGFALHAARGSALSVTAVDSSEAAVAALRINADLNRLSVNAVEADALEFIQGEIASGKTYGVVIVDPPRFAPSRGSKERALKHYFKLNLEASKLVAEGGCLVTCSCSHQIKWHDFKNLVFQALKKNKWNGVVLHQGTQSLDHPLSITCPETEYLKCLVIQKG